MPSWHHYHYRLARLALLAILIGCAEGSHFVKKLADIYTPSSGLRRAKAQAFPSPRRASEHAALSTR